MNMSSRQASRRHSEARAAAYRAWLMTLPPTERARVEARNARERERAREKETRVFFLLIGGCLAIGLVLLIVWSGLPTALRAASCRGTVCEPRACIDWRVRVLRPACERHRHLP